MQRLELSISKKKEQLLPEENIQARELHQVPLVLRLIAETEGTFGLCLSILCYFRKGKCYFN
jgi:hypothetical protein